MQGATMKTDFIVVLHRRLVLPRLLRSPSTEICYVILITVFLLNLILFGLIALIAFGEAADYFDMGSCMQVLCLILSL